MSMPEVPDVLEPSCEWSAEDVADPALWTEQLTATEIAEIDAAIEVAREKSRDLLEIGKADFPLPTLGARLKRIEHDLMYGRGFVLIRGLPRERYDNDQMCLAYWGIGAHLGSPWPQNAKGHLLGDVTDQSKTYDDPTSRGNELGQIGLICVALPCIYYLRGWSKLPRLTWPVLNGSVAALSVAWFMQRVLA